MSRVRIDGLRLALPVLSLLSLTGASFARAADYFVSVNGSDSNPGTAMAAPLRTIAHAAQLAGPGDRVIVRGGTYREMIDLASSRGGLPGRPMTITSYKDEPVVIKGSDIVTGWTLDHGALWKKTGWGINSQQLFAGGKPMQQIGATNPFQTDLFNTNDGSGAPNLRLPPVGKDVRDVAPGSFYYDGAAKTLYCELSDQSDPNKHQMEASIRNTVLNGGSKSYVTLHGLSLVSCNGTSGGGYTGVLQADGSHWTVDHCTFQDGDFCGIHLGGADHQFRHCRVLDNGDVGIALSGSDAAHGYGLVPDRAPQHIVFANLLISGNNSRHFDEAWNSGGIKAIPSVRDVTVTGCTVTENHGPGIWFDTDYGGIVIENNLISKNDSGIAYETSQAQPPDAFGAMIRNNRIVENKGQGIYVSASQDVTVDHNTCYRNDFDIVIHGMPRGGPNGPIPLKNNVVTNNIVDGLDSDIVLFTGRDASNNRLDGNFYVTNSSQITLAATTTPNYANSLMSIAAAQSAGFEGQGKSGGARWTNAAALDFRLRPGSPAAGKGWQPPR